MTDSPLSPDLTELPSTPDGWRYLVGLLPRFDPFADVVIPGLGKCEFRPKKASRAIGFFHNALHHVEGALARQPFVLQRWQQAQIANLFGWYRPDGTRRFRTCMDYEPRKNGKTPKAAGVGLFLLYADGEWGAEVQCAASCADQASKLFRHASGMIRQDDDMRTASKILDSYAERKIIYQDTESVFKVINAEASHQHGGNPHGVIIDELHALPNHELYNTLRTSMASANRPNSLFLAITTADFDRESPCNDMLDYAKKVRDGVISDPSFLPVIYEADREDDYQSPETWRKANPNLGISVSEEFLSRESKRASVEASYRDEFRRLHCNIKTEQAHAWIDLAIWDQNIGDIDPDPGHLIGNRCMIGVDLSSTRDITAVVAVFEVDGRYVWVPRLFLPEDAVNASRSDRAPYASWVEDGFLETTPGRRVDYNRIKDVIVEMAEAYRAEEIDIDPWNCENLRRSLEQDHGLTVVEFRQGYKTMSPACKSLDKLLGDGRIVHGGHPVLRWMASCAAVTVDPAENIKIVKNKSTGRVDGLIAGTMATHRLAVTAMEESGDAIVLV
jgi:phage terminase large subunit-like protein